jgi:hypothetical protein
MPNRPKSEQVAIIGENEAQRLVNFYTAAENEILGELYRAMAKGNSTQMLNAMRKNVQAILTELRTGSRQWCETAIAQVYTDGVNWANKQAQQRGQEVIIGFSNIHQQAAQVLAEAAYNRFDEQVITIGRRVDDIYRRLALENVRGSVVGYKSWQQVARQYRLELEDNGITGFKDKAGRRWNMKSYTNMTARTTTMEAHLEGTCNRLSEYGRDLVKISDHANECPKCRPWENKILSISGKSTEYTSLAEARLKGLFHVMCKHAAGLWVHELIDE